MVACATGPLNEELLARAVTSTVERTHQRPLSWFSDGWQGYLGLLVRAYRQPVLTEHRWSFQELLTTRIPITP